MADDMTISPEELASLPNNTDAGTITVSDAPAGELAQAPQITSVDQANQWFTQGRAEEQLKQEPRGNFGEVYAGIMRGIDNLQGMGYMTTALVGDAAGIDTLKNFGIEGYKENELEAMANPATIPSYKNVEDFGDFVSYLEGKISENAAYILPSLVSGGVGGVLAGGGRAAAGTMAKNLITKYGAEEAEKYIAKRAAIGRLMGAYTSSAGQEIGAIGGDIYSETGKLEPGIALGYGAAAGSLDTLPQFQILQNIFGKKAAGAFAQELTKKYGKVKAATALSAIGAAEVAATESPTETLQTIIERAGVKAAGGGDIFTPEGWTDIIDSTLAGLFTGGAFGGASTLAGTVLHPYPDAQVNNIQSEVQDKSYEIQPFDPTEEVIDLGEAQITPGVTEGNTVVGENRVVTEVPEVAEEIAVETPVMEQESPYREQIQQREVRIAEIETELEDETIGNDKKGQLRRRQLRDELQRNIAQIDLMREGIDPLGTEPTHKVSEANELTRRLQQPPPEQVLAASNQLESTVRKLRGTDKSPEAVKLRKKYRQRVAEVFRPYVNLIAGTGVKFELDTEYANKNKLAMSNLPRGLLFADYDSDGNISIVLPTPGEVERATPEATDSYLDVILKKGAEEEMVHAATFQVLKDEWQRKGSKGKAGTYIREQMSRIGEGLQVAMPGAMKTFSDIYFKGTRTFPSSHHLGAEFVRMVIQRARTGKLTEDIILLERIKQEGNPNEKSLAGRLIQKTRAALQLAKEAISRYLVGRTGTPGINNVLENVNRMLDRYGAVLPEGGEVQNETQSKKQSSQERQSSRQDRNERRQPEDEGNAGPQAQVDSQPQLLTQPEAGEVQSQSPSQTGEENAQQIQETETPDGSLQQPEIPQENAEVSTPESGEGVQESRPPKTITPASTDVQKFAKRAVDEMSDALDENLAPTKPRKITRATEWILPEYASVFKTMSKPVRESWDKAITYLKEHGVFEVTERLQKGQIRNFDPPEQVALNIVTIKTVEKMQEDMDQMLATTGGNVDLMTELQAMRESLTNILAPVTTGQGRAIQLWNSVKQMFGPADAVDTLVKQAKMKADSLTNNVLNPELYKALQAHLSRVVKQNAGRGASAEKIRNRIKQISEQAAKNPKKFMAAMKKTQAFKNAKAFAKRAAMAADNIIGDNTQKHMQAVMDNILQQIGWGLPGNTKAPEIERTVASALGQTIRDEFRDAGIIQPKTSKSKTALEQLQMVLANPDLLQNFVTNLETQVAEQYEGGKNSAGYKAIDPSVFNHILEQGYSERMRKQAVNELAAQLEIKLTNLIKDGFGGAQKSISEITAAFQSSLEGFADKAQIDAIVKEVEADLSARVEQQFNKLVTVKKGNARPTGGKVIYEAIGKGEIDETVNTIEKLISLSTAQQESFSRNLQDYLVNILGLPDTQTNPIAQNFRDTIASSLNDIINWGQDAELRKILAKVKESSQQKNKSDKPFNTSLEKIIAFANKGMMSDSILYNTLKEAFPRLNLPAYNEQTVRKIQEWGNRVSLLPSMQAKGTEMQKIQNFIDGQTKLTKQEMITSYAYWSMLSGFTTLGPVNWGSNAMSLMGETVTQLISHPKRAGKIMAGLYSGMQRGWNELKYGMQTGVAPSRMTGKDYSSDAMERANPDLNPNWDKFVRGYGFTKKWFGFELSPRMMMRFLRMTDAQFNRGAFEMARAAKGGIISTPETREMARKTAEIQMKQMEATDPVLFNQVMMEAEDAILQGDNQWAIDRARDIADQVVFTGTIARKGLIGMGAGLIQTLGDKYVGVKAIVPFTNVVAGVINSQLNWTPVGAFRWVLSKREGSQAQEDWGITDANGNQVSDSELLVKSLLGFMAYTGLYALFAQYLDDDDPPFAIYATGPKDPEKRRQWMESGGRPYSVKVGDTYINYQLSPLAISMGAVGVLQDKYRDTGKVEILESGLAIFAAGYSTTISQSFLSGMKDFFVAADSPNPEKNIARLLARTAGISVPNVAKQIDRIVDPTLYESNGFFGYFAQNVPIVRSSMLNPALNAVGEEMRKPAQIFPGSDRFVTFKTEDPFWKFIGDNRLYIPGFNRSAVLGDNPMTDVQKREYNLTAGPRIKSAILDAVPLLNRMNREQKQEYISNLSSNIKREVRQEMMSRQQPVR